MGISQLIGDIKMSQSMTEVQSNTVNLNIEWVLWMGQHMKCAFRDFFCHFLSNLFYSSRLLRMDLVAFFKVIHLIFCCHWSWENQCWEISHPSHPLTVTHKRHKRHFFWFQKVRGRLTATQKSWTILKSPPVAFSPLLSIYLLELSEIDFLPRSDLPKFLTSKIRA